MKICLRSTIATSLVGYLIVGCGIGTEIGNGFKPRDGDTDTTTDKPLNNDPTPHADTSPDVNTTAENMNSKVTLGQPTPGFAFNLSLLTSTCASPLAESIKSPFNLQMLAVDGTRSDALSFEFNADGAWVVSNKDAQILSYVTNSDSTSLAVTAKDVAGQVWTPTFSGCEPVQITTAVSLPGRSGTYLEKSVTLRMLNPEGGGDVVSTITWYLQTQTGSAPAQLIRIVLQGYGVQDQASIVLEAE